MPAGLPDAGGWPDRWILGPLAQRGLLRTDDVPALEARQLPTLWAACVASGIAADEQILHGIARHYGLPVADLAGWEPATAELIPEELARRHEIVPLRLRGHGLEVACADPRDPELESTLGFVAGRRVALALARREDLLILLERAYGRSDAEELQDAITSLRDGDGVLREMCRLAVEHPLEFEPARLVDALIVQAIRRRASDVHLEPHESTMGVRYRVDGVLHEVVRAPRAAIAPVISRLKVLANLDIADRLRPQDGRAQLSIDGRRVDLRISTLPVTSLGEKAVIRILDNGSANRSLSMLGFTKREIERLDRLFKAAEGLVLVAGPTGSGKTTTLYTALRSIQNVGINIVTVEDPIEYRLDGVTQVQVHERAGLTFATALRSILRQDPDVVLVGEIRDSETAEIALQAGLTGHLVLSTLHTNDAPSSIVRLMDIGIDLTVLAPALRGVIAQRLVRRVCPDCRVPRRIDELAHTQRALLARFAVTQVYESAGCSACDHLGYRGRIVVPEIAIVGPSLERAIGRRADADQIAALCRTSGMVTLWESGLERVIAGQTTLNELLDNIYPPVEATGNLPGPEDDLSQASIDALFLSANAAAAELVIEADPTPSASHRHRTSIPAALPAIASAAADVSPEAAGDPVPRRRVLLADEDADLRRTLRVALEQEGFRVLEAADGQTALEYARRLRPEFLVLELALQRLDGLGLLRALREEAIPGVQPVVLTTQDDPDMAAWAAELGAADFLAKPIEPRLLAHRLHAVADRRAA